MKHTIILTTVTQKSITQYQRNCLSLVYKKQVSINPVGFLVSLSDLRGTGSEVSTGTVSLAAVVRGGDVEVSGGVAEVSAEA